MVIYYVWVKSTVDAVMGSIVGRIFELFLITASLKLIIVSDAKEPEIKTQI